MGSVRGSSDNEAASCHNEFQAKMSSTFAVRYSLKLAKNEIKQLQVSVNETQDMQKAAQDMQKAAKRKELQLEKAIMSKQELVEALLVLVQNFTMEVQELHSTCDRILPIDCCQVRNISYR